MRLPTEFVNKLEIDPKSESIYRLQKKEIMRLQPPIESALSLDNKYKDLTNKMYIHFIIHRSEGIGLFRLHSSMNHSCEPTCAVDFPCFHQNTLRMIALRVKE